MWGVWLFSICLLDSGRDACSYFESYVRWSVSVLMAFWVYIYFETSLQLFHFLVRKVEGQFFASNLKILHFSSNSIFLLIIYIFSTVMVHTKCSLKIYLSILSPQFQKSLFNEWSFGFIREFDWCKLFWFLSREKIFEVVKYASWVANSILLKYWFHHFSFRSWLVFWNHKWSVQQQTWSLAWCSQGLFFTESLQSSNLDWVRTRDSSALLIFMKLLLSL